jgi:conjugative transfer pilus assembly protein TraH
MKKLLVAIALMIGTCQIANSQSLGDAFASLGGMSTYTNGGSYQGMGMTTVTGGSMDIRIPNQTVTLFTMSPPRLSMGCNGISAYFGGFSYMDGDQIQQLIQNIVAGIPGQLVMLAITQLCPQCADTLKTVMDKIQKLSQFAMDSCKMSTAISKDVLGAFVDESSKVCKDTAVATGTSDDTISAKDEICSNDSETYAYLREIAHLPAAATGPGQCEKIKASIGGGANGTWTYLTIRGVVGSDIGTALFLQSLMGTVTTGTDAALNPTFNVYESTMSDEQAFGIILCGTDPNVSATTAPLSMNDESTVKLLNLCEGLVNVSDLQVLTCNNHNELDGCDTVTKQPLVNSTELSNKFSEGMAFRVMRILKTAVNAVKNNQPIAQEAIDLIKISPFPLYKVINIAAVYPDLAEKIIQDNSQALGILLAIAYEKEMINSVYNATGTIACDVGLDKQKVAAEKAIGKMEEMVTAQLDVVDKLYARQTMIISQINQINSYILSDIYNSGAFRPK